MNYKSSLSESPVEIRALYTLDSDKKKSEHKKNPTNSSQSGSTSNKYQYQLSACLVIVLHCSAFPAVPHV